MLRSFSFCRGRPGVGDWELKTDRTLGTTRGHVDRSGRPMTCESVTGGASRKNAPVRAYTASLSCRVWYQESLSCSIHGTRSGRCLQNCVATCVLQGMLANNQVARDIAARCDRVICQGYNPRLHHVSVDSPVFASNLHAA